MALSGKVPPIPPIRLDVLATARASPRVGRRLVVLADRVRPMGLADVALQQTLEEVSPRPV
jgi:hypothetical protein